MDKEPKVTTPVTYAPGVTLPEGIIDIRMEMSPSGSFELKAIPDDKVGREMGIGIGSISIEKLNEGIYAINNVGVRPEYRRRGVALALYKQAADEVHALGGKLYTGGDVTELGKLVRESLRKQGLLGNVVRVEGSHRSEIMPISAITTHEAGMSVPKLEGFTLSTPKEFIKREGLTQTWTDLLDPTGKRVGQILIEETPTTLGVVYIEIDPGLQRRGIATSVYQETIWKQAIETGKLLQTNEARRTEEGKRFFNNLKSKGLIKEVDRKGDIVTYKVNPKAGMSAPKLEGVTVKCPICEKVIEIPEYNGVTRTDALLEHLKKEHTLSRVYGHTEEIDTDDISLITGEEDSYYL